MFEVGQKVLCVDDTSHYPWQTKADLDGLTAGAVYTVTEIYATVWGSTAITLSEINRHPKKGYLDHPDNRGFNVKRFRPLDEKDDPIEIFREMCRETEKKTLLPLSEERLKELLKDIIW